MKITSIISRLANCESCCDDNLGSSPSPRTNHHKWKLFEWNNKIGNPLYMTRWMIDLYFFSIRLHKFSRSDDQRAKHNHAWGFITFILKGGYYDVTPKKTQWCEPLSVHLRSFRHIHTIKLKEGITSWSLVITGPYKHRWGFYVKNKIGRYRFVNSQRYFRKYGHH